MWRLEFFIIIQIRSPSSFLITEVVPKELFLTMQTTAFMTNVSIRSIRKNKTKPRVKE